MALTVTDIATPNAAATEFPLGIFKAKLVDVTFDNSYPTTGEVLTAASRSWIQIFGAIPVTPPTNAAGTASMGLVVKKNATNTQLTLQLQGVDGAAAGKANLEEKANAFDASTFTTRLLLLGY
jgi:hypothetical protein